MKKIKYLFLVSITAMAVMTCGREQTLLQPDKKLTEEEKVQLIDEFKNMASLDQKNRDFLQLGTLDQALIDSVNKLPKPDQIRFGFTNPSTLSQGQEDSLNSLQRVLDLRNTERLLSITRQYGWPSPARLDSLFNPMQFLFHTPKSTIEEVKRTLQLEVMAGRISPISYATYVDNMRKKAFGQHQLYGTGDEYDAKLKQVVPPFIEDLALTNREREKLGLSKLKPGEYRLSK